MFKLHSEFKPTGDQPEAIEYLSNRYKVWKEISDFTSPGALRKPSTFSE